MERKVAIVNSNEARIRKIKRAIPGDDNPMAGAENVPEPWGGPRQTD